MSVTAIPKVGGLGEEDTNDQPGTAYCRPSHLPTTVLPGWRQVGLNTLLLPTLATASHIQ